MTMDELRDLAETWGGDIGKWPLAAREAARRLAATAEGKMVLERQARFDRLLSTAPEIDAERVDDASFLVLQRLAVRPQIARPTRWRLLRWPPLIPAASVACSMMVGAWLATAAPYRPPPDALTVMSGVFDVYVIGSGWVQ